MAIRLTSPAFAYGKEIPDDYTCSGKNVSPPLAWTNVPANTQSFAITVDDPDAPSGIWVHWLLYNLPPEIRSLDVNTPLDKILDNGARQGSNDYGIVGYSGPCPPLGKPHRYVISIYALDTMLDLRPAALRRMLIAAIDGHILADGELMGVFRRR
jgi:Raf kinase inhibitor-like YbhB/YbcL family protein